MSSELPLVLVVGNGAKALATLHALQPFLEPSKGPVVQVGWITNQERKGIPSFHQVSGIGAVADDDVVVSSFVEGPLLTALQADINVLRKNVESMEGEGATSFAAGSGGNAAKKSAQQQQQLNAPGRVVEPSPLTLSSTECKLLAPFGVYQRKLSNVIEPAQVQYSDHYFGPGSSGSPTPLNSRPTSAATAPSSHQHKPAQGNHQNQNHQVAGSRKMKSVVLLSDGTTIPFDRLIYASELEDLLPEYVSDTSTFVNERKRQELIEAGKKKNSVTAQTNDNNAQEPPSPSVDVGELVLAGIDVSRNTPAPRGDFLNRAIYQGGFDNVTPLSTEVFHLLDEFDQESLVSWLRNVEPVEFEAPKKKNGKGATASSGLYSTTGHHHHHENEVDVLNTMRDDAVSDSSDDSDSSMDDDEDQDSEEGQESEEELPQLRRPHQVHLFVSTHASQKREADGSAALSKPLEAYFAQICAQNESACWSFVHMCRFPEASNLCLKLSGSTEISSTTATTSNNNRSSDGDQISDAHTTMIFSCIREYFSTQSPVFGTQSSQPQPFILSANLRSVDLSHLGAKVSLDTVEALCDTFIWRTSSSNDNQERNQEGGKTTTNVDDDTAIRGSPVHSSLATLVLDNVTILGERSEGAGLSCLVTALLLQAQYHRRCFSKNKGEAKRAKEVSYLPGISKLSIQNCGIVDVTPLTKLFNQQYSKTISINAASNAIATHGKQIALPSGDYLPQELSLVSLNLSGNPLMRSELLSSEEQEDEEIAARVEFGMEKTEEDGDEVEEAPRYWQYDRTRLEPLLRFVSSIPPVMKELHLSNIGLSEPVPRGSAVASSGKKNVLKKSADTSPSSPKLATARSVKVARQALAKAFGALLVSSSRAERLLEILNLSGNSAIGDLTALEIGQALLNSTRSHLHTINLEECKAITANGIGFLSKCFSHLDERQLKSVLLRGAGSPGVGIKEMPSVAILIGKMQSLEEFSLSIIYEEQLSAMILIDQITASEPHKAIVGGFELSKCLSQTGGNPSSSPAPPRPLVRVDLDFPVRGGASPANKNSSSEPASPANRPPPVPSGAANPSGGLSPKGSFRITRSGPKALRADCVLPADLLTALQDQLDSNRKWVAAQSRVSSVEDPVQQVNTNYDLVGYLFQYQESLRHTTNPHLDGGEGQGDMNNSGSSAGGGSLGFSGMMQPGGMMTSLSAMNFQPSGTTRSSIHNQQQTGNSSLGGTRNSLGSWQTGTWRKSGTVTSTAADESSSQAPNDSHEETLRPSRGGGDGLSILTSITEDPNVGAAANEAAVTSRARASSLVQSSAINWTLFDEFEFLLGCAPSEIFPNPIFRRELINSFHNYRQSLIVSALRKASDCSGRLDRSAASSVLEVEKLGKEIAHCWVKLHETPALNADVVIRSDLRAYSSDGHHHRASTVDFRADPLAAKQWTSFAQHCLNAEGLVRSEVEDLMLVHHTKKSNNYIPSPTYYNSAGELRPVYRWGLQLASDESIKSMVVGRTSSAEGSITVAKPPVTTSLNDSNPIASQTPPTIASTGGGGDASSLDATAKSSIETQSPPLAPVLFTVEALDSSKPNSVPNSPTNMKSSSRQTPAATLFSFSATAEKCPECQLRSDGTWKKTRSQLGRLLSWNWSGDDLEDSDDNNNTAAALTEELRAYFASQRLGDIAERYLQQLDLYRPPMSSFQDQSTMPREVFQSTVLPGLMAERETHVQNLIEHWQVLEQQANGGVGAVAAAAGGKGDSKDKKGKKGDKTDKSGEKKESAKKTAGGSAGQEAKPISDAADGSPQTGGFPPLCSPNELMMSLVISGASGNFVPPPPQALSATSGALGGGLGGTDLSTSLALLSVHSSFALAAGHNANSFQTSQQHTASQGSIGTGTGPLDPQTNPMVGLLNRAQLVADFLHQQGQLDPQHPTLPEDTWTTLQQVLREAPHLGILPHPTV